ncbi:MAG: glycine zipper 2TM domain-containing protein [Reyranellaceae bacterium]
MINSLPARSRGFLLAACGVLALGLSACEATNTGKTYSQRQLGNTSSVETGTIVSAREVNVEGSNTGIGTAVGAGAGAVAGSALGTKTRTNILGAIGGAVLGGIIGHGVEDMATRGKATEFVVQRADGSTFAVVQTNEDNLQPGERVLIVSGDRTRLARDAGNYNPPPQGTASGAASGGAGSGGAGAGSYPASSSGTVTSAPPSGGMSGR